MDKGYEKEGFEKLGIKISVAVQFRNFCNKTSKSQSMTLLLMMEFFERNELSLEDDLKPGLMETENRIKKRINALIALFKNVEPKEKLILEKSFEQLENERLNKEFRARLKEKSESDYKGGYENLNNGE